MGINNTVRKIVGDKSYQSLREVILIARDTLRGNKKSQFQRSATRYSVPNGQAFFGYYDLNQFNTDETRILAHVVNRDADPFSDDVQIGFFDIERPEVFHKIATSYAWCWQQGSRLRWGKDEQSTVWFNDYVDGNYICKCVDISDGHIVKQIPFPLYDIDEKFEQGLTLDFERLQRYRPGYGYSRKKQSPDTDDLTIGLIDISSGERKNVVTLDECVSVEEQEQFIPYFNHLSFSPNGSRFLFFVVLKDRKTSHWKVKAFVYDLIKSKIVLLEEEERASHYAWKNDDELLITLMKIDHTEHYCLFNISSGAKTEVGHDVLKSDGHPTFCADKESFVSDTYPRKDNHQELFLFTPEKEKQRLAYIYHDPRGNNDKRCDLHPRLSKSQKMIAVDSLSKKNGRSIVLLEIEE